MPGQFNTESHVHHISPLFFFHCSNSWMYLVKKPNHLPLSLEMTLMFVDKSFPVSAKILLFQFKGNLKHFPLPEATQNSLDSVSSPLRRMFSRAHKFLRDTSASVCPTRWVSKPFCPEAQVQNDQGAMGFPAHARSPSQATHRSWGSPCAADVLRRLCKMKCSLFYHVQFENNSQPPSNMRHSICLISRVKTN